MKKDKAQLRAQVILRVQRGEITASEGAAQLEVSRKTYYQWEKRGLRGLLEGVREEEAGRPAKGIDAEKESLRAQVKKLEKELDQAKQVESVRLVLQDIAALQAGKAKSKKNSKR